MILRLAPERRAKLGDRNYFAASTGRITDHTLVTGHVFFDARDEEHARIAYAQALHGSPPGATIAVWARTPGVPAHVPVIGERGEVAS